jgi:hypothetical protein
MKALKPAILTLSAIVIASSSGFGYPGSTQAGAEAINEDLESLALQYISTQQGIAVEQLSIETSTSAELPLSGIVLADFKVMANDGRTFGVSFDRATRKAVDQNALAVQEQQLRQTTYGVLEPSLHDHLQLNGAGSIPVAIWVTMKSPNGLARGKNPDLNALAERAHSAQSAVADAARALGAIVAQADMVPVIFAELNAGQINALAHHPSVVAIDLLPEDLKRLNDDSPTSDRYTYIWSTATGLNAKIAVHEDDGVDNVNSFLVDPVYWCTGVGTGPGGTACTVGKNIGTHATNVAGVIASTHQWRRGGAWGIAAGSLLSANFQSFSGTGIPTSVNAQKIVNSATWALVNGADTINMSWGGCSSGSPGFYSRWADFLVKSFGDNIVVSSGNNDCGNPDFVGTPSLGWNTISVGSYFDNNTGSRTDDVFSFFTSFRNPLDPNSGRRYEKPDVTGMGGNTDTWPNFTSCFGTETTAVGGGVNDSTCGTSFAAPDVSALTALAVGKDTALRNKTESVKAIIMAGATHNIVDGVNYRDCTTSPFQGDCRDGAGAIDAYQTIQNVVVPGNWRFFGGITPASFNASGNIDIPVSLNQGKKARVVIAWDSTAVCSNLGTGSQACASDVLNADLDLLLLDPSNVLVASASSFQNSAEVVDFTPAVTGTFKIRVHRFRFDAGTNTFLGVAWNKNTADTLSSPIKGATTFALNTTKANQTTDKSQSFWDNYSGPAAGCAGFLSPETGLEKIYKVVTSSPGSITASLSSIVGFSGVNSDIDVIILKKSGAALTQNGQVVACGDVTATASSQPAGTYFIVVDGFNGSVANFSLSVNFAIGAAPALPEEPLPAR